MKIETTVLVLFGIALAAPAEAYDGTQYADEIVLGCANVGGTGNRTYLCINGSLTPLDTSCDMDFHVTINGLDGNDEITAVNVYGTYDCGTPATWNPVNMDGFSLYVHGGFGDDTIVGGDGNGYFDFYGDANNDQIIGAGQGSPSDIFGGIGDDRLVNAGGSNLHNLYGGNGSDCCADENGNWGVFDCGDQVGQWEWDVCAIHGGDSGETTGCEQFLGGDACE